MKIGEGLDLPTALIGAVMGGNSRSQEQQEQQQRTALNVWREAASHDSIPMSFVDLCLGGDVLEEEIDAFVEKWHEDENTTQELYEYLGMSWEEYSVWVAKPSILPFILSARKNTETHKLGPLEGHKQTSTSRGYS